MLARTSTRIRSVARSLAIASTSRLPPGRRVYAGQDVEQQDGQQEERDVVGPELGQRALARQHLVEGEIMG